MRKDTVGPLRRGRIGFGGLLVALVALLATVACGIDPPLAKPDQPALPERAMRNERGHTDFARTFTTGEQFVDDDDAIITAEVRRVGEVELTSGELMVSDPGYLYGDPDSWVERPIAARAPVGTWPVEVSLAHRRGTVGDVYEIAALRMRFDGGPATSWVPADVTPEGEVIARGVDSGTMMLADMDALRGAGADLEGAINEDLEASVDRPEQFAVVLLPGGGAYAWSQSGMGDGGYAVWWGFDDAQAVVEVVIDYAILVRNTWTEIDLPIDLVRRPGAVATAETVAAGLTLESVTPADAAGRWNERSSPYDTRPTYDADEIFLALRSDGRSVDVELRDASGDRVDLSGPQIGPSGSDDEKLEYHLEGPGSERVTTVHLRIFEGFAPLDPP